MDGKNASTNNLWLLAFTEFQNLKLADPVIEIFYAPGKCVSLLFYITITD